MPILAAAFWSVHSTVQSFGAQSLSYRLDTSAQLWRDTALANAQHVRTTLTRQSHCYHYNTPSVQASCTSLQSLCYSVGKNRSKVPSRKVTIHCPAPHCDSLMERPMATSERKRGYWQLKTENRRVYIVEQKKIQLRFLQ